MRHVLKEAFLVAMMVGGLMPRFLCRGIEAVRQAVIPPTPRRTVYLRWLIALLSPALILAPAAAQERAPVPGEVDTHVTQSTIPSTICQPGYAAKVRPPRKFTDAIKRRLVNGLPGSSQDYELDHLIPLGLGGHPTSANNLWLQNWPEAAIKDRDELRLHREVCAGRMTLEQAQHDMLATWGPR